MDKLISSAGSRAEKAFVGKTHKCKKGKKHIKSL